MTTRAAWCLPLLWVGMTGMAFLSPAVTAPPEVRKAFETDDEKVVGHPEGDAPALPKQVRWDVTKAPTVKNDRRQKISLAGWWRFSASKEEHSLTDRAQMGWIELPGSAPPKLWKLVDKNFAALSNQYAGQSLAQYPYYWIERDVEADIKWVDSKIYLVVVGPWSSAEVWVGYVPVAGVDRDNGKWFEITEALVYGGETPIAMRLKAPTDEQIKNSPPPYFGLELVPAGPRVDKLALARDPENGQIELTVDIKRPPFWLGLPIRLPELPLVAEVDLKDAAGKLIQETASELGTMPQLERNVAFRIPAPPADAPQKLTLHLRLSSQVARRHDEIFPVEFDLKKLPATKPQKNDSK